jgi:hypothetical protein
MATEAKAKRVNVSGTVTPALNEFIEEHRWTNRLSKSDVINDALVAWGKSKGFTEPVAEAETAEAPKADAPKPTPAKGK